MPILFLLYSHKIPFNPLISLHAIFKNKFWILKISGCEFGHGMRLSLLLVCERNGIKRIQIQNGPQTAAVWTYSSPPPVILDFAHINAARVGYFMLLWKNLPEDWSFPLEREAQYSSWGLTETVVWTIVHLVSKAWHFMTFICDRHLSNSFILPKGESVWNLLMWKKYTKILRSTQSRIPVLLNMQKNK